MTSLVHSDSYMKNRVLFFIAGSCLWFVLHDFIFGPTAIVMRQAAAVATVKSSNAAYIAQQAVESGVSFPWFTLGVAVLFFACFTRPILNAFKS